MILRPALIAAALALSLAGAAHAKTRNVTDPDAPRALPEQGPVEVRWENPAQFTEIRYSGNSSEAKRGNWVEDLALHLRQRAQKRLPAGERLEVDIVDIRRAGNYEPWRGIAFNDTRFIRDIYPPRITLNFRRIGADGQVIAQGERKLSDMSYLSNANTFSNTDPLRYEKSLINRWLDRELKQPGV
ncbi:DUF3016 domain-containing protein [Lysobacter sp. 5GHs7-4]|uniref:DUF3016 domain-containing protein n=1 Tax=Lysobacter sp. 5GHs7-4 TaxID=2904253 RepID=UPI0017F822CC|nr:DUF3016 domain-containing protein [Lysobacter sp. 5GHs7-4]NUO74722.1 DUF3016 domain-containing protein [Lysobacter sp.]UHQ23846.1 DUF3016 domain-containing protein [Lysobacter sp. 5GHs7-4]